jgi:hypothetical protein
VGEEFNVGLKALFDNMKDCKRIREKTQEVNNTAARTAVANGRFWATAQ